MKWYDFIAPVYDRVIRNSYLTYRQAAIKALYLKPGFTILDIGCGTGLNFETILDAIGPKGTIIGIDTSAKMLDIARQKIIQNKWENVKLLQIDAHKLTPKDIEALLGKDASIDSVICTLGFSVFQNWQVVFENSFSLLRGGGRYCIMDIFNEKITLRTRVGNIFAKSDNSRRVWLPLEKRCDNYFEEKYPMAHGYMVIVASGTKS